MRYYAQLTNQLKISFKRLRNEKGRKIKSRKERKKNMDPFDKNLLGLYLQNLNSEKDALNFCLVNKKFNTVCQNDNFFRLFLEKKYGPGIAEYKLPNETWKRYMLRLSFYKGLLEEEFYYKPENWKDGPLNFEREYFMKKYDTDDIDVVLIQATKNGDVEIVKVLLKDDRLKNTLSTFKSGALIWASEYGYAEIVKLLLEDGGADPRDSRSYSLALAASYNFPEVVRLLLEDGRADPSDASNRALKWAKQKGNQEIVDMLLKDGRLNPDYL